MRAAWLGRAGALGCLLLLVAYGLLWSSLVQQSGGAENYVRVHEFLGTLTGAAVVAGPHPALLYDPAAQESAQAALIAGDVSVPFRAYTAPPFAPILLAPLLRAHLAYSLVFTAWAVLTTAAAGLSIGLLAGRWPAPHGTPWLLMLAATSYLPLISSLMLGQQTMLALLGWIGLAVGLKAGRDWSAGAAAALAVFQPETVPMLLLLLLVTWRPRALAGLALTLALGALVAMPVLGIAWPLTYTVFLNQQLANGFIPSAAHTLGLILLIAIWWPRGRSLASLWQPATHDWDLRWTLSLLVVLPALLAAQPAGLLLTILPGWILATDLAAGASGGLRRFWTIWLIAGYLLAPATILLSPAFAWGGVLWWGGAVGALALQAGSGRLAAAPARATRDPDPDVP